MHFVRRNSVLFYDRGIVCYRSTPIPQHITPKPSLTTKTTQNYNDLVVNYEQSSDKVDDVIEHQIDFVPNKPLDLLDSLFELKKPEEKPKETKIDTVDYCGPSIFWEEVTKNWPKYDPIKEQIVEKSKPGYSYNVLKGKGILSGEKPITHNAGYMPPILSEMHENSYIYKNSYKTSEIRTVEHCINKSYRKRENLYSDIYEMELKHLTRPIGISNESATTDIIETNSVKSTIPEEEFSQTSTSRRTESSDSIILSNHDVPSSEVASIYTRIKTNFSQKRPITDEEIYKAIDSPFTIRSLKSFAIDMIRLCSTLNSKNSSRALSRYTTSVESAKPIPGQPILSIDETPEGIDPDIQLYSESFKRNSYMESKSLISTHQLETPHDSGNFESTSNLFTEYKIDYPENEQPTLYNKQKSSSIEDFHLNELYKSRNFLSTKSSCSDLYISSIVKTPSDISLNLAENEYSDASKNEIERDLSKESIDGLQKGESTISLCHLFTNKSDFQDQISKPGSFDKSDSTISLAHVFTNQSEFENNEITSIPFDKADSTISLGHMFTGKTELEDNDTNCMKYEKTDSIVSLGHMFTSKTQLEDDINKSKTFEKSDSTISLKHMFTNKSDTQDEFITESKYIEADPNDVKQVQLENNDDTTDFRRNVVRPLKNNRYDILVNGFEATAYIVNIDRPSTCSSCKIFFDYEDDKLSFKLDDSVFDIFATDLYCEIIRNKKGKRAYLKIIMDGCIETVIAIYCKNTEYIELLGGTIGWLSESSKINENVENSKKPKPRKSLFAGLINREKKNDEDHNEKRKSEMKPRRTLGLFSVIRRKHDKMND